MVYNSILHYIMNHNIKMYWDIQYPYHQYTNVPFYSYPVSTNYMTYNYPHLVQECPCKANDSILQCLYKQKYNRCQHL